MTTIQEKPTKRLIHGDAVVLVADARYPCQGGLVEVGEDVQQDLVWEALPAWHRPRLDTRRLHNSHARTMS